MFHRTNATALAPCRIVLPSTTSQSITSGRRSLHPIRAVPAASAKARIANSMNLFIAALLFLPKLRLNGSVHAVTRITG